MKPVHNRASCDAADPMISFKSAVRLQYSRAGVNRCHAGSAELSHRSTVVTVAVVGPIKDKVHTRRARPLNLKPA